MRKNGGGRPKNKTWESINYKTLPQFGSFLFLSSYCHKNKSSSHRRRMPKTFARVLLPIFLFDWLINRVILVRVGRKNVAVWTPLSGVSSTFFRKDRWIKIIRFIPSEELLAKNVSSQSRNPFCSPRFRASGSGESQQNAFAFGVPHDINGFHPYTVRSICL